MSRYRWPRAPKIDRVARRQQYNALTNGVLPPDTATPRSLANAGPLLAAAAPTGDKNVWVPIGPSTVIDEAPGRPRVAGRVRDLAVNDDGTRAYAAAADGGVWYTEDSGVTWSPLGNWLPTPDSATVDRAETVLACGCLLVKFDNSDPPVDDVYVGTGELIPATDRGTPGDRLGGVGVLHLVTPVRQALADPFGTHWKREAKNLAGAGIYRLARDPAHDDRLVAATSMGLFTRQGAFAEDSQWQRVSAVPFNFDASSGKVTTDLAWVDSVPPRLWVALLAGSDSAVYTTTDGVDSHYQKVTLDGVQGKTKGAAGARLGLAVAPSNKDLVYVLGTGPHLWQVSGLAATQIQGLPNILFGIDEGDQSGYDLAIGVHPDDPKTIITGGSGFLSDHQSKSCLFRLTINGQNTNFVNQARPDTDPTYVGEGVHPDIHQVRIVKSNGQVHVWIASDGGVFRSIAGGDPGTFGARNSGLAILEAGFVASHPESDAFVIAGAQDNGVIMRIGDTAWLKAVTTTTVAGPTSPGDAGGVVIHPVKKRFFAAQGTSADWTSNGTFDPPVIRHNPPNPSEKDEGILASFYSAGDARRVGNTNQVRLAIGTYRVWLADDWDPEANHTLWTTLPTLDDARDPTKESLATGAIGDGSGKIVCCRWADDNRLLVLARSKNTEGKDSVVRLLTRQADGKWKIRDLSNHHNRCFAFDNGDIPDFSSDFLPPLGGWSDIAVNGAGDGDSVSCYVACTGHLGAGKMDTLWWYDGQGKWYPTGLATPQNELPGSRGTKAPAYAVATDPGDSGVVYVGTAVGVWKGTQQFDQNNSPPTPRWLFEPFSNGLPEAAVQDLSLFHPGPEGLHPGPSLLRAALQSRGVWEVDLGTPPGPTRRTFLRMHPTDSRRTAPSSRVVPMNNHLATWNLHASPDVRLRRAAPQGAETAPLPPVTLLPPANPPVWAGNVRVGDRFNLWVFQTALHHLDPLCRPDGNWTPQFAARLQLFNHLLPVADRNQITGAIWTAVVTAANVFADPWDGKEPTEADLLELVVEPFQSADLKVGPPAISLMPPGRINVDVLVHHRDSRPVAAADVTVTLLRRQIGNTQQEPAIALSADWKSKVAELIGGGAPAPFPDDWQIADPIRTRHPASAVDARTPRAVTFVVDFSAAPVPSRWLLLAIVQSAPDPLTTDTLVGNTVTDLILNCHQVASRVVEMRNMR